MFYYYHHRVNRSSHLDFGLLWALLPPEMLYESLHVHLTCIIFRYDINIHALVAEGIVYDGETHKLGRLQM